MVPRNNLSILAQRLDNIFLNCSYIIILYLVLSLYFFMQNRVKTWEGEALPYLPRALNGEEEMK